MIIHLAVGFLSAIAVLVIMMRMNIRKFLGYPVALDVGVTIALAWLLYGTFGGMVSAIIGGLMFSGCVTVLRNSIGYMRYQRVGLKMQWVEYPAKWVTSVKGQVASWV